MFGHDGWYGQLARRVTFESVGAIARAAGLMLVREYLEDARLVVGYDRRFLADAFAREIARDLASLGIETCLIPRPVPLPALSMTIRHVDAVGGIMITGGSQPAHTSGITLRGWDGGALPRWILTEIESAVSTSSTLHRIGPAASVIEFDPIEAYLEAVGRIVPLRAIKQSGITLAIDSLWGTAADLLPHLTDGEGSRSVEIRTAHNPLIPEPGQLCATLFIELRSDEALREALLELVGIERSVGLRLADGDVVPCVVEEDHEKQLTREEITASVHYLRWELTSDQVERFAAGPVTVVCSHPAYPAETVLSDATHAELTTDLRKGG
jgi:phosphomannomutase